MTPLLKMADWLHNSRLSTEQCLHATCLAACLVVYAPVSQHGICALFQSINLTITMAAWKKWPTWAFSDLRLYSKHACTGEYRLDILCCNVTRPSEMRMHGETQQQEVVVFHKHNWLFISQTTDKNQKKRKKSIQNCQAFRPSACRS